MAPRNRRQFWSSVSLWKIPRNGNCCRSLNFFLPLLGGVFCSSWLFLNICLEWYQAFLRNGCKTSGLRLVCCELGSWVLETGGVWLPGKSPAAWGGVRPPYLLCAATWETRRSNWGPLTIPGEQAQPSPWWMPSLGSGVFETFSLAASDCHRCCVSELDSLWHWQNIAIDNNHLSDLLTAS